MDRKSADLQCPIFDALLEEEELSAEGPHLVQMLGIRHAAMAVLVRDSAYLLSSAESPENLETFQALITQIDQLLDWVGRDKDLLVIARDRLATVVDNRRVMARRH